MNEDLKQKLLEMAKLDDKIRHDLIHRGVLFDGYHPEMERVHNENAACLERIINEYGWPSKNLVGDEAASAAWLIVQHAISRPYFQRSCFEILTEEVKQGSTEPSLLAFLQDRINVYEGKLQIYGTQFEWDGSGKLNTRPIHDPENVDAFRRSVGLQPLKEAIDQMRFRADQEGDKAPSDIKEREERFIQWARNTGWRN